MNSVSIIGNLTRDPELRSTPSGTSICSLRVAVNDREKQGDEWVDRANYFDVTVWGKHGENCAQYLAKGRQVGVSGRLRWREWDAQDGTKRQAVEIVAFHVDWLGSKADREGGQGQIGDGDGGATATPDFVPAAGPDDDIPF